MIIHHISKDQIAILEAIFAYLTDKGWVIPEWINLLRDNPFAV